MDIISINNLTYIYNNKKIFDNLTLNIKKGEFVCITGENACGKTTLVKLISGLLYSDSVFVLNKKMDANNAFDIRKKIGVIFDDIDNYFLCDTVIEELAFTLENLNIDKDTMDKRIAFMTKKFKINNILSKNPKELSGGEKMKVGIICALMHNPKILILDTLINMIDLKEKNELINILNRLHKKGLTIILMTNDLSLSYKSDRIIVLNKGKIVLDDIPKEVFKKDKLLIKYGVSLPFEVELSIKLQLYGLLNDIYFDTKDIVGELWH